MKYLALLKDSLVETLDRKSLYVVLSISALLIIMCASIGFRPLDVAGALKHVLNNFDTVTKPMSNHPVYIHFDTKFEATGVETTGKDHKFTLRVSPVGEFHREVLTWKAVQKGNVRDKGDPVEGIDGATVADPGSEEEVRFLRAQFRNGMIPRCEIEPLSADSDSKSFSVFLKDPRYVALEGGHEASFLFGAFSVRLPVSLAVFLLFIEVLVADWIGGFFGVMLAVIFTAGFVPGMLQKGTLDLVLAKPVRRPFIILTKYLGGLFYVIIPATVLIGGCWLVISWRSGFFNFGFLASIGALAAIFAVLYSFAVLMGILTRSTIATILLTIALWFFSFLVAQGHLLFNKSPELGINAPPVIGQSFEAARLFLPRTTELSQVSNYYIVMGNLGPELKALLEGRQGPSSMQEPEWLSIGLSSLGFIAAMLGLACWAFSRRDY